MQLRSESVIIITHAVTCKYVFIVFPNNKQNKRKATDLDFLHIHENLSSTPRVYHRKAPSS